ASIRLSDTWEWTGNNWLQKTAASSPSARSDAAVAYDALRGRIVLFGGEASPSVYLGDTWEWDGVSWAQISPVVSPSARACHAMAYDASGPHIIMFGGGVAGSLTVAIDLRADTWGWDGSSWKLVTATYVPPVRSLHGLAYDSARGRVVLFGGLSAQSSLG